MTLHAHGNTGRERLPHDALMIPDRRSTLTRVRILHGPIDALLAPVAYARARSLAPWVIVAMLGTLVTSEPSGVPMPGLVLAWNIAGALVVGVALVALRRGLIPTRYGHVALTMMWWIPVSATLLAHGVTGTTHLSYVFAVELITAGVSLHTGLLVLSMVVGCAAWLPSALRDASHGESLPLVVVTLAVLFSYLFHRAMTGSLIESERQRHQKTDTAAELARQLEELRRSELERAQLQEQLVHAQRMEAVGTLAAGLAHDMNNILGSIATFAELVRDQVATPALRADVERILTQAHRGAELTKSLVAFARRGQYRKRVVEADAVIREVVPLLGRTLPKTIEITCDLGAPGARLEGDASQLSQVLVNLAVNATDAMQGHGRLAICTRVVGSRVQIEVTDTGCGMDEATRLRVFEPFFTTKPLGKGTGLGLSTAWGIVTGHDGTVAVRSAPGQGSTFLIELPTTSRVPTMRHVERIGASLPLATRATALVIDDETLVRQGARRLLERAGYDVLEAGDGAEGLRVFADDPHRISIVLLDMSMPVMGGAACFDHLRAKSDVPVLVTTGYTNDAEVQTLLERGASLLEKPYASADLVREVRRLIAAHRPMETRSVA